MDAPAPATIVGVLDDVRYLSAADATQPEIYYSFLQLRRRLTVPVVTLVLRTAGDPANLAPALRTAVAEIDNGLVPDAVSSLEARILTGLARPQAVRAARRRLRTPRIARRVGRPVRRAVLLDRPAPPRAGGAQRPRRDARRHHASGVPAGKSCRRGGCNRGPGDRRGADPVDGGAAVWGDRVRPDDIRRRTGLVVRGQCPGVRTSSAPGGPAGSSPRAARLTSPGDRPRRRLVGFRRDARLPSDDVGGGGAHAARAPCSRSPGQLRDHGGPGLGGHAVAPARLRASRTGDSRCVVGRRQPAVCRDLRGGRPSVGRHCAGARRRCATTSSTRAATWSSTM